MRVVSKCLNLVAVLPLALGALASPARAAQVDVSAGVLSYRATFDPSLQPNDLTISIASGTYTIDDPHEPTIDLAPGALAAGCATFDNNTVTCPAASVTSLDVATFQNNDTIVLIGVTVPAIVAGGTGNDMLFGSGGDDTFIWSPGDGNDFIDGGPGVDTLVFNGANISENFTITPHGASDGLGFDLSRDVGTVQMQVPNAEILDLRVMSGNDTVNTTGLADTVQIVRDAPSDGFPDTLIVNAQGHCARLVNDMLGSRYEVIGRQPIHFLQYGDFQHTAAINSVCGAVVDVEAGVLSYTDTAQVANQLTVSRSADGYVIDDPGEAVITLDAGATAAGCTSVDANTASCPQSAVASFDISTDLGADSIDLSGSLVPALVVGGIGNDVMVGGAAADTFVWNFNDGSDSIDGGPSSDALEFNGNHMSEIITIQADGTGFMLYRDLSNIIMEVASTELLELSTFAGEDRVFTSGLVDTAQRIVDDPFDGIATDTLTVDAQGLCVTRQGDTFNIETRQPIEFVNFTSLLVENNCGPDPCATAAATQGCTVNGVPNQLCVGTTGNDTIVGTAGADVIKGGDGNDRIRGGAGADLICGEAGNDVLSGGSEDDTIVGWSGADQIKGDGGNDMLLGGLDADIISGATGDDRLDGGEGNDRLRGQGGNDTIQGGPGFDLIDGGPATDTCADFDQSGPFLRCEE